MKTLIVVLIIAAFLQSTIVPVDLVLIILICRAYVRSERQNLYLGFAFGLLTAHLNLTGLGLQSLIYLAAIQATQALSRIRLAGNPLMIVPICLVFLSFSQAINSFINHQTLELTKVFFVSFLSLPTLFLLRLWEERFIVRKEIKLRM
ncbi:MAG: hypothetical protein M1142_04850 [Patescibacteria group bacterium]|nr:hypothetical protein [Patescibacteria group bacterium]